MEGESQKPWGVLRSLTKGVASIPLYGNEVIIGKNVIGTTNKNISRVHFKLIKKDDKVYYIQDCSTNGTFINNSRLKKNVPTRIRDGVDVVVLNHVRPDSIRFMFSVEDDEDSSNPKYIEFCERYDYGEYLGEGSYAIVRLVTDKATGTQYAMKTINREKQGSVSKRAESVFDEVKVLSALSHPKIVNTKEAFIGFRNIYIVMDLIKGGDLFTRLMEKGHFSERNARNVIRSILEGIEYLHSKGIAHRDLKPENIMLVDKDSLAIKIADFGLSRTIDEGSFMSTLCGTPSYAAPEIIQKKGYTTSVDIWSVGVIAYVLLSQELPFYSKGGDVAELCKEVVKGVVVFRRKAVWDTVSQEAKDFILRLLRVNPDERPTAFDALDDPWFMKDMGDDSVIDELLPEPEPEPEPEQEALSEPVEKKLCPTI